MQAMAAVERLDGLDQGPLPDGASSVEASVATLRATIPFGDVGAGYENAIRAAELERPESPFWPVVCWARGMGHFFRGEFAEAEPWFAEAALLAPPAGMWLIAGSALGLLTLLRVLEMGFFAILDRPFDPLFDWSQRGSGLTLLEGSMGHEGALVLAAGAIVLAAVLVVLMALSARRLACFAARHRTATIRTVAVLTAAWVACFALDAQIVPPVPVAARPASHSSSSS